MPHHSEASWYSYLNKHNVPLLRRLAALTRRHLIGYAQLTLADLHLIRQSEQQDNLGAFTDEQICEDYLYSKPTVSHRLSSLKRLPTQNKKRADKEGDSRAAKKRKIAHASTSSGTYVHTRCTTLH